MLTTTDDYAAQITQETIPAPDTDVDTGLTTSDVSKRIERYGYNDMNIAEPVMFTGHSERDLALYAALASQLENKDPIELPIFHYIAEHFSDLDWQSYRQLLFTPFDPIRKRTRRLAKKGRLITRKMHRSCYYGNCFSRR